MKGDLSRSTWAPRKHYSSVRSQQGRVQLDADWNEQADIQDHLRETGVADVIGACGVPEADPGFGIGLAEDGADLTISPGRIYVDGILCQHEADADPITYLTQPDLPGAPLPSELDEPPEPLAGLYLAYLDVWRRHVTVVEDPEIRERALGGPDTATRLKTVAQVKLWPLTGIEEPSCTSELPGFATLVAGSTGRLRARTQPSDEDDSPCVVPASAGYTRLENQLYRIEIHDGGGLNDATFKWSRNNGSLATEWLGQDATNPNLLRVGSTGRDQLESLENAWVEITDDHRDLRGETGQLVRALVATGDILEIDPEGQTIDFASVGPNPKIRRWDQPVDSDGALSVEIAADNDGYLRLEGGIEVRFEAGSYRSGDYWLIPARAFVGEFAGDIEWPQEAPGQGVARRPAGIEHHYCRLGLVEFDGEAFVGEPTDCRPHFPSLTEMTSFFQVGGGGQSARPGQPLPCPLAVGVRNGEWPVVGARVEFAIGPEGGTLLGDDEQVGAVVIGTTDDAGVATCAWVLPGAPEDDERTCLSAGARLLDPSLAAEATPLFFTGELALASEVAYDPSECPSLEEAGARTVQDAIDVLCQSLGLGQPGIVIEEVSLLGRDRPIEFEADVDSVDLSAGLAVRCDRELSPEVFAAPRFELSTPPRPNCTLELEIPYPLGSDADRFDVIEGSVGFQRVTLRSTAEAEGATIVWRPTDETASFLAERMLNSLGNVATRIQARLTIKGNFVWGPGTDERRRLYLDGDAYGQAVVDERMSGRFPSGNGVEGGDFEMWFWIVPSATAPVPGLTITAVARGNEVSGVVRSGDARVPGIVVTLTNVATGQALTGITDAEGNYSFVVEQGDYVARAAVGGETAEASVSVDRFSTISPTFTITPTFTFQPTRTVSPTFTFGPPVIGGGRSLTRTPVADDSVTRVNGIGPVRRDLLAGAGIGDVRALAGADTVVVADTLGISEEAAADFIGAAGALLPPGTGRSTTEVSGIGPVGAERLAAGGVGDLAALTSAEPAAVAELLSISEVRAMGLVEAARALVED